MEIFHFGFNFIERHRHSSTCRPFMMDVKHFSRSSKDNFCVFNSFFLAKCGWIFFFSRKWKKIESRNRETFFNFNSTKNQPFSSWLLIISFLAGNLFLSVVFSLLASHLSSSKKYSSFRSIYYSNSFIKPMKKCKRKWSELMLSRSRQFHNFSPPLSVYIHRKIPNFFTMRSLKAHNNFLRVYSHFHINFEVSPAPMKFFMIHFLVICLNIFSTKQISSPQMRKADKLCSFINKFST